MRTRHTDHAPHDINHTKARVLHLYDPGSGARTSLDDSVNRWLDDGTGTQEFLDWCRRAQARRQTEVT